MLAFQKILRFSTVGVINTFIDVTIFYVLNRAGLVIVLANIISTSVALATSLLLNSQYTFRYRAKLNVRQVVTYIAITIIGLWAIQPLVIHSLLSVSGALAIHDVALLGFVLDVVIAAKLCATAITMLWNYVLYALLVFSDDKASDRYSAT